MVKMNTWILALLICSSVVSVSGGATIINENWSSQQIGDTSAGTVGQPAAAGELENWVRVPTNNVSTIISDGQGGKTLQFTPNFTKIESRSPLGLAGSVEMTLSMEVENVGTTGDYFFFQIQDTATGKRYLLQWNNSQYFILKDSAATLKLVNDSSTGLHTYKMHILFDDANNQNVITGYIDGVEKLTYTDTSASRYIPANTSSVSLGFLSGSASSNNHVNSIELTTVVPEPGSLSLMAIAGCLLISRRTWSRAR